jgi:hypothetical protein
LQPHVSKEFSALNALAMIADDGDAYPRNAESTSAHGAGRLPQYAPLKESDG